MQTLWGQVEMEGVECFRIAASLPQAASQELQWYVIVFCQKLKWCVHREFLHPVCSVHSFISYRALQHTNVKPVEYMLMGAGFFF